MREKTADLPIYEYKQTAHLPIYE